MFKRILSALSGKKSSTSTPVSSAHTDAPPPQPDESELITVYDSYGREMQITRNEWRNNVFLPNLREKWNSADELYSLIISGLNDGFVADLIPAAAQLVEIDSNPERSHVIQGIVLLENGQLDAAENALRTGMAKVGATGTLLTNLAKVFSDRGEQALADETLWHAVQADPNQENGLLWWAAIQREKGRRGGLSRSTAYRGCVTRQLACALVAGASLPGTEGCRIGTRVLHAGADGGYVRRQRADDDLGRLG